MMMRRHGYIPLHSIASDAAPALSPESTFFIEDCSGASPAWHLSRTGPTVGNDDEGEIERRGDYQTSEGVDERVDCES